MKKRIVIINGVGGSGKDTFVELCAKHTKVINISSVVYEHLSKNIFAFLDK